MILAVLAVQEVDEELFGLFVDSLHLLHVFELIVRRHDDWADLAAPFERLEILLIQVEPGMPQYLCDSFVSKSHFLLHFQQMDDKVSRFGRNSGQFLHCFQTDFFLVDFRAQRIHIAADVGSFLEEQFENSDAQGIIVDIVAVVLMKQYLRSHIAWSSPTLLMVFLAKVGGHTKVG